MSSELERPVSPTLGSEEARGDKPHQQLPALITAAFEERDPKEQRRLTTEVVETLIAMRAPGDEADEARLIVAHLDAKTLTGLVDQQARGRAHTEAVETLLSLGFPHALKVNPEDLKRFRDDPKSLGGQSLARAKLLERAGIIAGGAQVLGLALVFDVPGPLPMTAAGAAMAAGAVASASLLKGKGNPYSLLAALPLAALAGYAFHPFLIVAAINALALLVSLAEPSEDP